MAYRFPLKSPGALQLSFSVQNGNLIKGTKREHVLPRSGRNFAAACGRGASRLSLHCGAT